MIFNHGSTLLSDEADQYEAPCALVFADPASR
jgi:hypothetical protein